MNMWSPDAQQRAPASRFPTGPWHREGLVLAPSSNHPWWRTHAQAPTILPLSDRLWRVYFAAREEAPRSHILCVDLDPSDSFRVLRLYPDPVLEPGQRGAFDSQGMGPATALVINGKVHLYYTGIVARTDVPYQLAIGLAVSDDGLRFHKMGHGPLLSTGPSDPFFMSTPCVRPVADGFEMWYCSAVEWRDVRGRLEPSYELRHTRSDDGVIWSLDTILARGLRRECDAGLGRAWVVERVGERTIWYGRRGLHDFRAAGAGAYRMLHASLGEDGRCWDDEDPVLFANPPMPGDWDSWMQAYPCIAPLGNDLIMLYNGNDFGRGGFGRARLIGGAAS